VVFGRKTDFGFQDFTVYNQIPVTLKKTNKRNVEMKREIKRYEE